jgi:hypothetical protein
LIPFLENYRKSLSAVQGRQLFRLLSQMRDRGEIRSHEEFTTALTELGKVLQRGDLAVRTPFFTFRSGDLLESDAVRTFIEMLSLDLEAALEQIEQMSNTMRAHHRILNENYFDALEAALDEMEARVRACEILEFRKFSGFTRSLKAYTFSGGTTSPGITLTDDMFAALSVDGVGGEDVAPSPPRQGEAGIHLGIDPGHTEYSIPFTTIEVWPDSSSPQTELSTATADNSPSKAIDGNRDTSWRHSILLTEHPAACRLRVAVGFAGAERINALSITPLADLRLRLYDVSYLDSGGDEVGLPLGVYGSQTASGSILDRSGHLGAADPGPEDWILNNERTVLPLGDITARKVIITLQQDTGSDGTFFYYDGDLGSWRSGEDIEDCLAGAQAFLAGGGDTAVPVTLGIMDRVPTTRKANFSEYCFGLRDVSALFREFSPNGYFTPEPFTVDGQLKTLALHADVESPYGGHPSVEFTLRKEDYDSQGGQIGVETIPLLPYGEGVTSERLFLSRAIVSVAGNDCGELRFYPDFSAAFSVYSNNSLLTLGTHYSVSVDGEGSWETTVPPSGTPELPARCLVRVYYPNASAIYRVEYTPLVSTMSEGGEVWLNSQKSVRLERYQVYTFSGMRPGGEVAYSRMGLQIMLRANTLNTRETPFLREVILLGG